MRLTDIYNNKTSIPDSFILWTQYRGAGQWSFSHSIHQTLEQIYDNNSDPCVIDNLIKRFLKVNLKPNGTFYLIHFDSQSEEQSILLKQWAKIHPLYKDHQQESHSFKIIKRTFETVQREGYLDFSIEHLPGKPIIYKTMNEALEVFINFHLEGALQRTKDETIIQSTIEELKEYFSMRQNDKGEIIIQPNCYIMHATRTEK